MKLKSFFNNLIKDKKFLSYMIVIFISIFLCIPLFSKYMDISRDDGIQHICRLIGNFSALKEGNIFPVIISSFCNGFGYSWNIFYSPLTAYIPLIFKIFTSSYVLMLKLFMMLTVCLSGIFMFKFVYRISTSYKAGVIAAILYMSAPYHLTDLYNRIAVAELASFIFLPIVFLGMYNLFHLKNKKPYEIIFGAIGLILTHNVMALYAAIFCFIYMLIHYKQLKDKLILKKILISIILILLCTSFYIIPLLEHMLTTEYEVFLPDRMYKDNTLISAKLSISELFIKEHYEMNFHIGILIIIGFILTFIYCYKNKIKKHYKEWIYTFMLFGFISTIMTLKIFPFEHLPNILKMIQFPWRMMEYASFFFSIVASIGLAMFLNRNRKKELLAIIFIMFYLSCSIIFSKIEVEIPFNEEKYLTPIPVTSATGKVHAGLASFEYLPKKAFQNRSYIEERNDGAIILDGEGEILNQNKNGTNFNFVISKVKENSKLELPYIYYLGYDAKLETEDGKKIDIKIEESENGFCMITLPSVENAKIEVSYTGTTLMKISYALTALGIISIICSKFKIVKKLQKFLILKQKNK